MNKTIVMTACQRPEYTQRVVDSLSRCYGVSNYRFVPHAEGVNEEVVNILRRVDFCETEVQVNKRRLGHTLNTHVALAKGFELSDYVILIEDDTLLAKDFLLFHEFCKEKFKDDKSIYTVAAGHYSEPGRKYSGKELPLYKRNAWFTNQGWGTWIDRWEEGGGIKNNWENPEVITDTSYSIQYKYGGWDGLMNRVSRKDRKEILPIVSRVKNIGAAGGVHTGYSPKYASFQDFHEQEISIKDWADSEWVTPERLKDLSYEEKDQSFLDYKLQ